MHLYRVGIEICPQGFVSRVGPVRKAGDEAKNGQVKVGVDLVDEGKPEPSVEIAGSSSADVHGTVLYIPWIGGAICSMWVVLFKTVASISEFCECAAAEADMISFSSVVKDLSQVQQSV